MHTQICTIASVLLLGAASVHAGESPEAPPRKSNQTRPIVAVPVADDGSGFADAGSSSGGTNSPSAWRYNGNYECRVPIAEVAVDSVVAPGSDLAETVNRVHGSFECWPAECNASSISSQNVSSTESSGGWQTCLPASCFPEIDGGVLGLTAPEDLAELADLELLHQSGPRAESAERLPLDGRETCRSISRFSCAWGVVPGSLNSTTSTKPVNSSVVVRCVPQPDVPSPGPPRPPPHWTIRASDSRCVDDPFWVDADGDGCAEYQAARTWCNRYGITMQALHNCPDTCRSQICLQRHFDNAARDHSKCKSQPCRHGADCIPNPGVMSGYQCQCTPGWVGGRCELVHECPANVTQAERAAGCVPPRKTVAAGPDRSTRTTITSFLTAATAAGLSLILGGRIKPLRQCTACGVPYSLADGARLVAYCAVPMNLMTVIWTLALGYVKYAPLFLLLLLLSSKAAGSSCCGDGAATVTPDSVIWMRMYLIKEVICTMGWSVLYTWAVYQEDVGGRVFSDAIFYFIGFLCFESYSTYIIWSFLKRFSAGELEPDPTNAELRLRRRREAGERARANLLEAWARAGRIRFNDTNFWDEVEAAAAAAENRHSDAGGITAAAIAELPVSTYTEEDATASAAAGEEADFSEASTCVICMEDYEAGDELITLPNCSHRYHASCISAWLDKNNSCPNCRVTAVETRVTLPAGVDLQGMAASTDPTAAEADAREFFRRAAASGGSAHDVIQAATILLNQMTAAARSYAAPPGAEAMDRGDDAPISELDIEAAAAVSEPEAEGGLGAAAGESSGGDGPESFEMEDVGTEGGGGGGGEEEELSGQVENPLAVQPASFVDDEPLRVPELLPVPPPQPPPPPPPAPVVLQPSLERHTAETAEMVEDLV